VIQWAKFWVPSNSLACLYAIAQHAAANKVLGADVDFEIHATGHPKMSAADWQATYRNAFELYYSPEHIEKMFRRAKASGIKPVRLVNHVLQFYFIFMQEKVHPLQGGFFRRKVRTQRRSGLPLENPLLFYPRRLAEIVTTHARLVR
jgi:hypothetical protein